MKAAFDHYYSNWVYHGGYAWVIYDENELTPLMVADNTEAVSYLIESSADVNAQDSKGRTPLMFQSFLFGSPDSLKLLLENGANINAVSKQGRTALHFAVNWHTNLLENIEYLIKCGIDLNTQDINGMTALMYAVNSKNVTFVKQLIDAGADVYAKNSMGMTALMLAVCTYSGYYNNFFTSQSSVEQRNEYIEMLTLLIEAGCTYDLLNMQDNMGWTALKFSKAHYYIRYAKRYGFHVDQFLIESGADTSLGADTGFQEGNMPDPIDLRYWFFPFLELEDITTVDTDK
jgi:ankyrin repeat protein